MYYEHPTRSRLRADTCVQKVCRLNFLIKDSETLHSFRTLFKGLVEAGVPLNERDNWGE